MFTIVTVLEFAAVGWIDLLAPPAKPRLPNYRTRISSHYYFSLESRNYSSSLHEVAIRLYSQNISRGLHPANPPQHTGFPV